MDDEGRYPSCDAQRARCEGVGSTIDSRHADAMDEVHQRANDAYYDLRGDTVKSSWRRGRDVVDAKVPHTVMRFSISNGEAARSLGSVQGAHGTAEASVPRREPKACLRSWIARYIGYDLRTERSDDCVTREEQLFMYATAVKSFGTGAGTFSRGVRALRNELSSRLCWS